MMPSRETGDVTLILRAWSEGGRFRARILGVHGGGFPRAGQPDVRATFADRNEALAYIEGWLQRMDQAAPGSGNHDEPWAPPPGVEPS
jgi:hypothetical protein